MRQVKGGGVNIMNKVPLHVIPVMVGFLFMFACSRTTPSIIDKAQPVADNASLKTYAVPVGASEKTVDHSSSAIIVKQPQQAVQTASETSSVIAAGLLRKRKEISREPCITGWPYWP